jgi:hypothetical protein
MSQLAPSTQASAEACVGKLVQTLSTGMQGKEVSAPYALITLMAENHVRVNMMDQPCTCGASLFPLAVWSFRRLQSSQDHCFEEHLRILALLRYSQLQQAHA